MTAKILIVDDIAASANEIKSLLDNHYFLTTTANDGNECIKKFASFLPDLILLDVVMPGMDGYQVCKILKEDPSTTHIPIIMVSSRTDIETLSKGFAAGADDFILKPINGNVLIPRIQSLVRIKMMYDELKLRMSANEGLMISENEPILSKTSIEEGAALMIGFPEEEYALIDNYLESQISRTDYAADINAARDLMENDYHIIAVDVRSKPEAALRFCSHLRANQETRNIFILFVLHGNDHDTFKKALEIGGMDFILRPVDNAEIQARIIALIRRRIFHNIIINRLEQNISLAVTDSLTGLNNRRYFENYNKIVLNRAEKTGKPCAFLVLDLDFFKRVNDTHGHDIGDDILKEVSERFKSALRSVDTVCRIGGEEFIAILPGANEKSTRIIGERVCEFVRGNPFIVSNGKQIDITISCGASIYEHGVDTSQTMLKRADKALYRAKENGRDRLVIFNLNDEEL